MSSHYAVFFAAAILNSHELTVVLNVCCDTDLIVVRKVARKYENLCLNLLHDVLSITRRKQCFSLSNVLICIIDH